MRRLTVALALCVIASTADAHVPAACHAHLVTITHISNQAHAIAAEAQAFAVEQHAPAPSLLTASQLIGILARYMTETGSLSKANSEFLACLNSHP